MSEVTVLEKQLPVFETAEHSRELFAESAALIGRALESVKSGTFEYPAVLPEVVGYIEPSERDYFVNFPAELADHRLGWERGTRGLAKAKATIEDDLAMLGVDLDEYDEASLTILPRQLELWPHIDLGTVSLRHANTVFYLCSDKNPTIMHEGNATIYKGLGLQLLKDFEPTSSVAAPDFAIVRLLPLTVHSSERAATKLEDRKKSLARAVFANSM